MSSSSSESGSTASSESGSTASSTGGISFEELSRGLETNYAFNLVDLGKNSSQYERVSLLIDKVNETIDSFEIESEKTVEHFCIGKTYVEAKAGKTFNPNDVNTWRLRGISQRWHGKYKKEGYDGLVVLCVVSRAMLKEGSNDVWNQQTCVLGLESALIYHFAHEICDQRLANQSLAPGKIQKNLAAGYVIYIAFKYENEESGTEASEAQGSETEESETD